MSDHFNELAGSLRKRMRPEDVAELIEKALSGSLSPHEERTLRRASTGALSKKWGYSSMPEQFRAVCGLQSQLATARELFPGIEAPVGQECDQPLVVSEYIGRASRVIAKEPGQSDFLAHRLNRSGRNASGLAGLSKRQYNKRFRLLSRMERKLATLEREILKREYGIIAKSRLASRLTEADLGDRETVCFLSYFTARSNLRSVFTNRPQDRPYDEIADMLFNRCRRNPTTNWWAIAHVYPNAEVLSHLSDKQKGQLLGIWYGLLRELAEMLKEVWEKSRFDRKSMIVKKGDDSSTWNGTAGAWNKVREAWIELLFSMGIGDLLEDFCPGKVLRLMAADVAYWHRITGGGLEPDTAVWAELPPPWEVLNGQMPCTAQMVETACQRHGVDPIKKGWIAPKPDRVVAKFRPTPELVHGVEVIHPVFATILRKAGVFSGKA